MSFTSARALAAVMLGSVLALAGCGQGAENAASGDVIEVSVAEQGAAAITAGIWPRLAADLGYLEEEGIQIREYVSVTTGAEAVNGMLSGAVQISHIGVDGLTAASKGAEVIGIAAVTNASVFTVIASGDVQGWEDLRGKRIAVGSVADITRAIFDRVAVQAGIDPANDLEYVGAGATSQRLAAVSNGQAAATLASYPAAKTILETGDFVDLGFAPPGTEAPRIITTDIEASKVWAEQNPEAVTAYLRAIVRAVDYVRDPANKDDAISRIVKLGGDQYTAEAIETTLDVLVYEPTTKGAYFPESFKTDETVFNSTVEAYRAIGVIEGDISRDDYVDYSYLDTALDSVDR